MRDGTHCAREHEWRVVSFMFWKVQPVVNNTLRHATDSHMFVWHFCSKTKTKTKTIVAGKIWRHMTQGTAPRARARVFSAPIDFLVGATGLMLVPVPGRGRRILGSLTGFCATASLSFCRWCVCDRWPHTKKKTSRALHLGSVPMASMGGAP